MSKGCLVPRVAVLSDEDVYQETVDKLAAVGAIVGVVDMAEHTRTAKVLMGVWIEYGRCPHRRPADFITVESAQKWRRPINHLPLA